jgi:proteasome assembly chaperone (PAC2) family protein
MSRGIMDVKIDVKELDTKIQSMKKMAEELKQMGEDFPALNRNISRILASIKMLELNISDVATI